MSFGLVVRVGLSQRKTYLNLDVLSKLGAIPFSEDVGGGRMNRLRRREYWHLYMERYAGLG